MFFIVLLWFKTCSIIHAWNCESSCTETFDVVAVMSVMMASILADNRRYFCSADVVVVDTVIASLAFMCTCCREFNSR